MITTTSTANPLDCDSLYVGKIRSILFGFEDFHYSIVCQDKGIVQFWFYVGEDAVEFSVNVASFADKYRAEADARVEIFPQFAQELLLAEMSRLDILDDDGFNTRNPILNVERLANGSFQITLVSYGEKWNHPSREAQKTWFKEDFPMLISRLARLGQDEAEQAIFLLTLD